jgi:hypothetical protein
MKLELLTGGALCALLLGMAPAVAGPSAGGGGDPFELTFNATGGGTLNACTGTCSFGPGPDNGTAVSNVGGLGGNGFDYKLPQSVVTGCCVSVDNSSGALKGLLDFTDATDLVYIVSGNLVAYPDVITVTAAANGTFTYLGPYPATNQYNGTLPSAVPAPLIGKGPAGVAALTLLGAALVASGGVGRRRRSI